MLYAAVVLAAGESSRMGRPKAILPVGGMLALQKVLAAARAAGCDPVIAVLGFHEPAIRGAVDLGGTVVVVNPRPERGRTSSIQVGLTQVPVGRAGALIWPVDHPFVAASTLQALCARHTSTRAPVVLPMYRPPHGEARRGHPVLLDKGLFDAVEMLGPDQPLRDMVHAYGRRVEEVVVDDPGVIVDLDTPEDYEAALRANRGGTPPGK